MIIAENSKIQWTDHTFNPVIGCAKVSPGCENCYAEELMDKRYGRVKWGKGQPRLRTSPANWKEPLKWNRQPIGEHRLRVFCASLSDWLDDEWPIEVLADLLKLIHDTQNLDWLLLSKRVENFWDRVAGLEGAFKWWAEHRTHEAPEFMNWLAAWINGTPPANVRIGTTVENQKYAEKRHPLLMSIPAKVHFWSAEPLLSMIDAADIWDQHGKPDWVICGGESGKNAREMNMEWALDLQNLCQWSGVAFFMKQLGGKRNKLGNLVDFPEELRVREFPKP